MIVEEINTALCMLNSWRNSENLALEFQEFIDELIIIITLVEKETRSAGYSKDLKRRLKTCLYQFKIVIKRMQPALGPVLAIPEVMHMYSERLKDCLLTLLEILKDPNAGETNEGFIWQLNKIKLLLKDAACSKLVLKEIDALLTHALTIAKLCTDNGFNEIAAACKHVLEVSKSFEEEQKESEFLITSLAVNLGLLERRINIAMLQLFLEVMSNPVLCVKKLVTKCLGSDHAMGQHILSERNENNCSESDRKSNNSHKSKRKPSDLNEDVSWFDTCCDRMELIGNYSLSSTDNDDVRVEVETVLSSLGYCSDSLIPVILTYYCDPSSQIAKSTTKLLVSEWMDTVKQFDSVLDRLIDPANLVQVAIEEFESLIDLLKNSQIDVPTAITKFSLTFLRVIKLIEGCSDLKLSPGALEPLKEKLARKNNFKRLSLLNNEVLAVELESLVKMLDLVTVERLHLLIPNSQVHVERSGIVSPVGDIDSAFDLLDAAQTPGTQRNKRFPSIEKKAVPGETKDYETPRRTTGRTLKYNMTHLSAHLEALNFESTSGRNKEIPNVLNDPRGALSPVPSIQMSSASQIFRTPVQTQFTVGHMLSPGPTPGRMAFPTLTPLMEKAVGTSPFTPVSLPRKSVHRIVIQVKGEPGLFSSPSINDASSSEC